MIQATCKCWWKQGHNSNVLTHPVDDSEIRVLGMYTRNHCCQTVGLIPRCNPICRYDNIRWHLHITDVAAVTLWMQLYNFHSFPGILAI